MNSAQIEIFNNELDKLNFLGGINGIAIVNHNGLTILSRLPREIDERKFGAMAATMFGAMETAATALNKAIINLTVEYNDSQLVILAVNEELLIVSLIELNIDLGLFFIEIEDLILKLREVK